MAEIRKCPGCGAVLQSTDPKLPGYTPKPDGALCQRCFRLTHYDDLTVSMREGIDPDEVIDRIAELDALVLWVVDLFDFEASMIPGLNRRLRDMDIIMAATKRDLLPETMNHEKIARFVFSRLKEEGVAIHELILSGKEDRMGAAEIMDAVKRYGNGRPVVVMGRANAGKSTLLNRLMDSDALTMSRFPGTTLDFNEMTVDGITFIDTPGIEISHSILMMLPEKELKAVMPRSAVKPKGFQLKGDQSFAVGGLARLDLAGCEKAGCVWYISGDLPIHRGKIEKADGLWEKEYGKMLKPAVKDAVFSEYRISKKEEKLDIVVDGLGWACVSGHVSGIRVKVPKGVNVTFRKAMV
ncbi:MAG: ribosome biogenesis GTPase YqeH [Solobacterium sp.]|nr:ribosome biogenesis GTPase YqeH [Solobacterium sp.]